MKIARIITVLLLEPLRPELAVNHDNALFVAESIHIRRDGDFQGSGHSVPRMENGYVQARNTVLGTGTLSSGSATFAISTLTTAARIT